MEKDGYKSEAEWKEIIAAWSETGMPRKTWCREQGFVYSQFQYWYHKQLKANTTEVFPEEVEEASPGTTSSEVQTPKFIAVGSGQRITGQAVLSPLAGKTGVCDYDIEATEIQPRARAAPVACGDARHLRVNLTALELSIDIPEDYKPQFVASLIKTLRTSC